MLVGLLGGSHGAARLEHDARKRLTMVGTTLRARPLEEKITATQRFAAQVIPWLERGLVRPIVDSEFPFEEVVAALARRIESGLRESCFTRVTGTSSV